MSDAFEQADPKPPTGTRVAGRRLWSSVVDDFDLDEHELALLAQLVRTLDQLNQLDAIVRKDGPMVQTPQGPKMHPALIEARQQRIAFARLEAVLRLPTGEASANARQRRVGARGVYGIRGAV